MIRTYHQQFFCKIFLQGLLLYIFFATPQNLYAQYTSDSSQETTIDNSLNYEADSISKQYTKTDTAMIRKLSNEKWQQLTRDQEFKYSAPKQKKRKQFSPPLIDIAKFFSSVTFKLTIFFMVVFLLVFILYRMFFTGDFPAFRRVEPKMKTVAHHVDDLDGFSSWDQALQDALKAGDYRMATRILYLQTLQKLHQKKLIQYEQKSTNLDFRKQLSKTPYHASFTILTRYFDYVWYGNRPIDQETFLAIESQYRKFHTDIL